MQVGLTEELRWDSELKNAHEQVDLLGRLLYASDVAEEDDMLSLRSHSHRSLVSLEQPLSNHSLSPPTLLACDREPHFDGLPKDAGC